MQKCFARSEYLDTNSRIQLAPISSELVERTGLSIKQISQWFKNRRRRIRTSKTNRITSKVPNEPFSPQLQLHAELSDSIQQSSTPLPGGLSAKLTRPRFAINQLAELQKCFAVSEYLDMTTRNVLVERTGLSIRQISNWFKKKRRPIQPTSNDAVTNTTNNVPRQQSPPPNLPDRTWQSGSDQVPTSRVTTKIAKSTVPKMETTPCVRVNFSQSQLAELERCFERSKYLDTSVRYQLLKRTKLTTNQISNWFAQRRSRWRKTEKGPMTGNSG